MWSFLSILFCLYFKTCSGWFLQPNSKTPFGPPHLIPTIAPLLGECRGTDGDGKPDSAVSGEAGGQEAENRRRL